MRESQFQADLICDLKEIILPGSIILKNDANYIQGFPDLTILYKNGWAVLECKKSLNEPFRPNQEYYLDLLDEMSFASMICPENREAVLHELQRSFKASRSARISRCI